MNSFVFSQLSAEDRLTIMEQCYSNRNEAISNSQGLRNRIYFCIKNEFEISVMQANRLDNFVKYHLFM